MYYNIIQYKTNDYYGPLLLQRKLRVDRAFTHDVRGGGGGGGGLPVTLRKYIIMRKK